MMELMSKMLKLCTLQSSTNISINLNNTSKRPNIQSNNILSNKNNNIDMSINIHNRSDIDNGQSYGVLGVTDFIDM